MALWICNPCTTAYSVGAERCPQCGADDHREDHEEVMPKITLHGGPSNAAADGIKVEVVTPDGEHREVEGVTVDTGGGPFEPLPDVAGNEELENTEKVVNPDYPKWTVEQLREQLASRDLVKTGNKDELIARLLEDAAEQSTE